MAKWTSKTTVIAVLCSLVIFLLSVVWSMNERNTEMLRGELGEFRAEFRQSRTETRESYATIRRFLTDAHPKFASALLAVASAKSDDDPLSREQEHEVFYFLSGPMFEYVVDPTDVMIAEKLNAITSLSNSQREQLASAYIHASTVSQTGDIDPFEEALMMRAFDDLLAVQYEESARRMSPTGIDKIFSAIPPLWVIVLIFGGVFAVIVGRIGYEIIDD